MNALATVTHRTLATVDLVIIGVYFLVVFSIGLYFARKERTSTDHFLASRDIGWFFIERLVVRLQYLDRTLHPIVRPEPSAGQV